MLKLSAPVCFWGGLDPVSSEISDPRHPEAGVALKDRVVAIPAIVGSSSSSQFLLELMRLGNAPRAIVLGDADLILAVAVVVGREMGYGSFPILRGDIGPLTDGAAVQIVSDGTIRSPA